MWPFYTTLTGDGRVTASLRAEHLALAMFGLHQQSQSAPMHRADDGLGKAMARLRASERYSADAIDRRFTQAATATDLDELGHHVRGLTTMLKTIAPPQPIDYTRLFQDLCDWQRLTSSAESADAGAATTSVCARTLLNQGTPAHQLPHPPERTAHDQPHPLR